MYTAFEKMPDDTKLWVYALDRALTAEEEESVAAILLGFMREWTSHDVPVTGAFEIVEDRFLLLAGYCADGIGGCSTDSSVRTIKEIEQATGVNAFDRTLVFFRDGGGGLVSVPRVDFRELVNQGHVTDTTPVFDSTIQTVGELRAGHFEKPFEKSWHARAFARSS